MVITSFYYRQNGEVIRVEAENFTQVSDSTPQPLDGIEYKVDVHCGCTHYARYNRGEVDEHYVGYYTATLQGPFSGPITPGLRVGGFGSSHANRLPPLEIERPGGGAFMIANGQDRPVNKSSGDNQAVGPVSLYTIERTDGQPNPPSDSCVTTFYRGGQAIHTLYTCPSITEAPPDDECEQCCASILATLRGLTI